MCIQSLFPNIRIFEAFKELDPKGERYTVPYIERESSLILSIILKRRHVIGRGKSIRLSPHDKKILKNWVIQDCK